MTNDDFAKIFYSNFSQYADWENINEINWMYQQGLFTISSKIIASSDEFLKRIDFILDPNNRLIRSGESNQHLALKSLAKEYLIKYCNVVEKDLRDEYPLIGFEVDIIDKDLHFPMECGDTNALKLEKYLALPVTKKMLVLPYPHLKDLKIFEFIANPKFFEYIKHKQNFLNQKNAKLRK